MTRWLITKFRIFKSQVSETLVSISRSETYLLILSILLGIIVIFVTDNRRFRVFEI